MTSTDQNRLLRLERRIREGDTLTSYEAWELEQLRDDIGQLDALPDYPSGTWRDPDTRLIDRDTIATLAGTRLRGFDAGEQIDAFSPQTLLL